MKTRGPLGHVAKGAPTLGFERPARTMNKHRRAHPGLSGSGTPSNHDGVGRRCRATYRLHVVYAPIRGRTRPRVASHSSFGGRLAPVCGPFSTRLAPVYPSRTSSQPQPPFAPAVRCWGCPYRTRCESFRARNELEPVASRTTGTPPAGDTSTAGSSSSRHLFSFGVIASWETRVAPGGSGVKTAQRARGRSPLCANKERAARPSFLGARSGPPSFLDTNEITRPAQDRCVRRNQ